MPNTIRNDAADGGGLVANRVLITLLAVGVLGVILLPFATMAPNRLVSGQPVGLLEALLPWQWGTLLALGGVMLLAAFKRPLSPTVAPVRGAGSSVAVFAVGDVFGRRLRQSRHGGCGIS